MGGFLQVAVSEAPRPESINLRTVPSRGAPDTALRHMDTNAGPEKLSSFALVNEKEQIPHSIFAQQDQGVNRQRALCRNPCRHEAEQGHRHNHAGQDHGIAWRGLIDDES